MENAPTLVDWPMLACRRDRAMARSFAGQADFLWTRAADGIAERLEDVTRDFPDALLFGTGAGAVQRALPSKVGSRSVRAFDPSPRMAAAAGARPLPSETLPVEEGSADLALSVFLMHWSNDPIGHLIQLARALRPDGLAIAVLFGGQTLSELRAALATAEAEVTGGLSPRVAPMGEIRDLGALLQRAGLAMPVADSERLAVTYADPLALLRELRAMGETNILAERPRRPLRRQVLARALELYGAHYAEPGGRVRASFEIVTLTGWAPAAGQPRALRPGSAKTRLAEALGTVEIPTGEKPGERS